MEDSSRKCEISRCDVRFLYRLQEALAHLETGLSAKEKIWINVVMPEPFDLNYISGRLKELTSRFKLENCNDRHSEASESTPPECRGQKD